MRKKREPRILVIDDDISVCKALSKILTANGCRVTSYTSAVTCLKKADFKDCDIIISDVIMPDMDGLEFLTQVKTRAPWIAVLLLTGFGSVPLTTEAFKRGVVDFFEKPLKKDALISAVESAFRRIAPLSRLTKTEALVLRLICAGKNSQEVASLLSCSKRTIEVHRRHIMKKLNVQNTTKLIKRAYELGFV